jgi:endonuclease/exonuclease/phosphatase family metal-dependent hydrolase
VKLATYNIHFGLGVDGRYDLPRIADAVRGADIIALQEVERFFRRSGMTDQVAEFAALLPEYYWIYGEGLDVDASSVGPDGQIDNRRRQFGNMLLSRFPILSRRNHLLPKWGTVSQISLQRSALEGVIALPSGPVKVYTLHLHHLAPALRLQQVDALLEVIARAPREGGVWCGTHYNPDAGWTDEPAPPMPAETILLGDFNFTCASEEYERMVGPYDAVRGRLVNVAGLADAWVAAGHGEEEGATVSSDGNGRRLDYCFVSAWLAGKVRSARVDVQARGSNHQPLYIDIDL